MSLIKCRLLYGFKQKHLLPVALIVGLLFFLVYEHLSKTQIESIDMTLQEFDDAFLLKKVITADTDKKSNLSTKTIKHKKRRKKNHSNKKKALSEDRDEYKYQLQKDGPSAKPNGLFNIKNIIEVEQDTQHNLVPTDTLKVEQQTYCSIYDTSVSIQDNFECVYLVVKPNPQICLYPDDVDVHVSRQIRRTGTWEPHILQRFHKVLWNDPATGFIDIGANIGFYTIVAASNNHQVLAIEPYTPNLQHLAKAIQINQLQDNVTVLQNIITDTHAGYKDLKLDPKNQGGIQVRNGKNECSETDCKIPSKSIVLDDLLEVITFEKAIIKIDIEGHEHKAFQRGKKLFSKVYITHIFMEWMKIKNYQHSPSDRILVLDLLNFLQVEGYTPFSAITGTKVDPRYWYSWPDDVIWKHDLVGFVN